MESMFLNRTNVKLLDVAQVGDKLYYFSAGFLTFKQSEFTSCLSADRAVAETRVPGRARVSLVAGLSYLESIVRCRGANETGILVLSRSVGLVKI
jgi:hypothetical protein